METRIEDDVITFVETYYVKYESPTEKILCIALDIESEEIQDDVENLNVIQTLEKFYFKNESYYPFFRLDLRQRKIFFAYPESQCSIFFEVDEVKKIIYRIIEKFNEKGVKIGKLKKVWLADKKLFNIRIIFSYSSKIEESSSSVKIEKIPPRESGGGGCDHGGAGF